MWTRIKATTNVIIFSAREVRGVTEALVTAGVNDDVDIISMSLGMIWPIQNDFIALAAIYTSIVQEKLIFCAAGTLIKNAPVIFPANLPSEITVAVTGANIDPDDQGRIVSCRNCHAGHAVDLTVVMEKEEENTGPLTTPMRPDSNYPDRPQYIRGSSAATATAAGIAALVWAAHPNETKEQIYQRLADNTSPYYTTTWRHGHGILYADWAIDN